MMAFEGFVPKSQDLGDDDARLSYLLDLLNGAGLKPRTCELLFGVPHDYSKPESFIDMQLSLNPAASLVTHKEKELLRKDVTEEVMKWTMEGVFATRPSLYLVHARKTELK
ncbi:uncharacterized protein LOC144129659 [Amblyomma americanum]